MTADPGEDVGPQGRRAGGDTPGVAASGESLAVPHKTKRTLTDAPAVTLLGVYPKEPTTSAFTKTCTWMFTAALFVMATICKQVSCPSVGEWINKRVRPDNGILFSIKKIKSCQAMKRQRNLKCMLLSERSRSAYGTILTLRRSGKGKTPEPVERPGVPRGAMNGQGAEDF